MKALGFGEKFGSIRRTARKLSFNHVKFKNGVKII